MYNESRKKAFIKQYTQKASTAKKVAQIFSWFEPYEEAWGGDISQQKEEILQPVVINLTGVRTKSVEAVLVILREYVKWCASNGYETSQAIFNIRTAYGEKIRKQMVANPSDLKERLDGCFGKAELETVDLTYKVFMWLAFLGLSDRDAVRVTSDCVDFKKMVIRFEGEDYEICRECVEDLRKVCELTSFWYHHPPNYTARRDRAGGNVIIRGFRSPTVNLKSLRPVVNKKIAAYSIEKEKGSDDKTMDVGGIDGEKSVHQRTYMSYNKVHLSGVFYRMFEAERSGVPVDFSEYVGKYMANRVRLGKAEYAYSDTRTHTTVANTLEKDLCTDYEKWKCAF